MLFRSGLTVEQNLKRTKTWYDKELKPYHILYKAYLPSYWWWETLELLKRLAFSGGIYTFLSYIHGEDSSSLPLLTAICQVLLSFLHIMLLNYCQPFYSRQDKIFVEYISWSTFFTNFYGVWETAKAATTIGAVAASSPYLNDLLALVVEILNLSIIPMAILLYLVERWEKQINHLLEKLYMKYFRYIVGGVELNKKVAKVHIINETETFMAKQDSSRYKEQQQQQAWKARSEKIKLQRRKYVASMKKRLSLKKNHIQEENNDDNILKDENSDLFFM